MPFEGSTKVAAHAGFRKLLLAAATSDMRVPSNEGSFRPSKVTAPPGSIFNPRAPASAEARFSQCSRMIDFIHRALTPVMPDKVIAGSSASIGFAAYSGVRPSGDHWVFLEVNEGLYGGRPRSDGPDSIDNLMASTRNNPLEGLAMHIVIVCGRFELRDDAPPGAGELRGGRCTVTDPGRPGEEREMHSKFSGLAVEADDVMTCYSPNGGGYGGPLSRPATKVLEDVLDGFCSADHARAYGVVVDLEAGTVDMAATEALRAAMRGAGQD